MSVQSFPILFHPNSLRKSIVITKFLIESVSVVSTGSCSSAFINNLQYTFSRSPAYPMPLSVQQMYSTTCIATIRFITAYVRVSPYRFVFHSSSEKSVSNISASSPAYERPHCRFVVHEVRPTSLSSCHSSSHRPSTSFPIQVHGHWNSPLPKGISQRQRVTKPIIEYLRHVRSTTSVCSCHSGSSLLLIALSSSIMYLSTSTDPSFFSDYMSDYTSSSPPVCKCASVSWSSYRLHETLRECPLPFFTKQMEVSPGRRLFTQRYEYVHLPLFEIRMNGSIGRHVDPRSISCMFQWFIYV